jgi:excisionase family DNA binding protein
MTNQLLTAADIAELLNLPESWVREATRQGHLPHLHLGRYIRYQASDIDAWLADHKASPGPGGPRRPHRA